MNEILDKEQELCNDPIYVKKTKGTEAYLKLLSSREETKYPRYWTHYKEENISIDRECKRGLLDPNSGAYKGVHDLVMKTWDPSKAGGIGADAKGLTHRNIEVKKIWTIENPVLMHDYLACKKNLCYRAVNIKLFPKITTVPGVKTEIRTHGKMLCFACFLILNCSNFYFLFIYFSAKF